MANTRIKICGITSVNDGLAAVRLGADAIGLVFYGPSPRFVTADIARAIALAAGPLVTVTGLFVNATAEQVEAIVEQVPLHLLQFHGDETDEFCRQFHRPYIKAIRVGERTVVEQEIAKFPYASGLLLDAYRAGVPGGTGEVFNWQQVPPRCDRPLILAGGLTAGNVAAAIQQTRPYGVDVSGGVEVSPGIKDANKIAAFITAATGA